MADLVRFHDWIFDRDQINTASIKEKKNNNESLWIIVVELKNEKVFELICDTEYFAKQEFDYLTARINPLILGNSWNHYLVTRMSFLNDNIKELKSEIQDLMKAYKKIKDKEIKKKK